MNNRERLIKTFEHEEPDRVLVHWRGFLPNGTFYQDWLNTVAEDLSDDEVMILPHIGDVTLFHWAGQDTIFGGIGGVVGYPSVPLLDCIDLNPGVEDLLRHLPDLSKARVGWNGSIHTSETHNGLPYSWYHDGFFRKPEVRDAFYERYGDPMDEKFAPTNAHMDGLKKQLRVLEEMEYPKVMLCFCGGFWEPFFEGCGIGPAGYMMRKRPDYVDRIMSDFHALWERSWKLMLDAGAEVVAVADDLGQKGRGLLSVEQWRRFIKPHFSSLCNLAHKRGAYTWQHCCGFMEDFLPDLIDAGLDAIQSLEPAAGVDLARIKEAHGDKITFVGGMDTTNTMSFGTVEECVADAKKCLKAGMPGGGYIAGGSHRVIDVPVENFVAVRDTIREFGKYPCVL
ncbi:MAG: uroporphyrinogen decarboxylase family protein [Promethearchaeota archaeon]